ncbi:MAG: hypothetical protein KF712_19715 [Akkermansiaceae bacterium]|nr:hypothetical protein [Akkermansiaceae bacterium]
MMECFRGEIVGPSRPTAVPVEINFAGNDFIELEPRRRGPVVWRPDPGGEPGEVLYYDRESPHRKYGAGLLHPAGAPPLPRGHDPMGSETKPEEETAGGHDDGQEARDAASVEESGDPDDGAEDFEVTGPDLRRPSTIGISFRVRLEQGGGIAITLPREKHFGWQAAGSAPFQLNGRYESCNRRHTDEQGLPQDQPMWRRHPAVLPDAGIFIRAEELTDGRAVRRHVVMPEHSPLALRIDVYPRALNREENCWLLTVVLRNMTPITGTAGEHQSVLYQTYFEVAAKGGTLVKYPESGRPFDQLDEDEKSLALLYRESATWGIGHGCACGWDAELSEAPEFLFADVMPAVELPSMTPDIKDADGNRIELSMRALAGLTEDGTGPAWQSLENLSAEYEAWIEDRRTEAASLGDGLGPVAMRHLDACARCLARIDAGISLLRSDARVRRAFRLANLSMLLQQIGTKQLDRRPLEWSAPKKRVSPAGVHRSPWEIYEEQAEKPGLGSWRAFQIAFLLMSLDGSRDGESADREIVDLIWFPTGGGKTEAYLAVMAFYMFHERLRMGPGQAGPARDGTNVLMRYTLRMLTTQQFQRAASLICAMEFLRRNPAAQGITEIPGRRFSLGLWIGEGGSPNTLRGAEQEIRSFRTGHTKGNPLVLTECPWCRAGIGRCEAAAPKGLSEKQWNMERVKGIDLQTHLLHCTDIRCAFGDEHPDTWLPVEVIDERIYQNPPSLVISTADKLAMIAYRPAAGALFGRNHKGGRPWQESMPPGLIIQDELHLISGPLGTMYALYEGVLERLCSHQHEGKWIKPKLIASTATIRGAGEQVKALYARTETNLFPGPGLHMGDSFFGRYAKEPDGKPSSGRLYLGIHATDYGSALTTQVRAFTAALFRPFFFAQEKRDPWWTLLAFYNSIRELGGAKTLFDSDIRSRLKFVFNREGGGKDERRNLKIVEELTSRLSQAEIVGMMDSLSTSYVEPGQDGIFDACLASNIIEVGVDIDRLSLMGVVGQPKTTATYIQVTGRVGRRWKDRPGLILTIYNPSKSRDRSHFEQFHSYHRRLYERVEPTSATPFALSAIQRGLCGALLTWARQHCSSPVYDAGAYHDAVEAGYQLLRERCTAVQSGEDLERSLNEMERIRDELAEKWDRNPQEWEKYPPDPLGEYLMLWPGQYATRMQADKGIQIPTSMRQVDRSAELRIHDGYAKAAENPASPTSNP